VVVHAVLITPARMASNKAVPLGNWRGARSWQPPRTAGTKTPAMVPPATSPQLRTSAVSSRPAGAADRIADAAQMIW
jgi:hypothetical protein